MNKTAIVVGSGFGGISAALRLKSLGYEVSIYEKLNQLGGRARVFKKSGFTFDAGPTVITAPFLFNELFELFKKKWTVSWFMKLKLKLRISVISVLIVKS